MNENDRIKDLELQARNTRHLVDRIIYAAYGIKVQELIKAVRGVVVTICFLVALFAESWVEWIL